MKMSVTACTVLFILYMMVLLNLFSINISLAEQLLLCFIVIVSAGKIVFVYQWAVLLDAGP